MQSNPITSLVKKCSRCQEYKSFSEFGANRATVDRLSTYCRICARAITAEWRAANLEKSRLLGREGKRKERSEKGEEATRAEWNAWYQRNAEHRRTYEANQRDPLKASAHNKVNKAIRKGVLVRPTNCQRCDVACKPDAHHHDYSKPLDVEWLCRRCHRNHQEHVKLMRPG